MRKRPGTRFIQEVNDSTKQTLLTPFRFSVFQSFILEWSDHTLRFYQNRAPVLAAGVPYSITTPYAYTDLFDSFGVPQLMFAQSADVVYVTHRSKTFPVYKLEHFGTTNWQLVPVTFVGGPFGPSNPDSNPIVYASGETGNITLYASANIFDPDGNGDLIGSYFQLVVQSLRELRPWEVQQNINNAGVRRRFNGVTYEAIDGQGTAPWTTGTVPPTHIYGAAWDGTASGHGVLWDYRDNGSGLCKLTGLGAAPSGNPAQISAITNAKPPVVTTTTALGVTEGQLVFITGVIGMTEVNDRFFRVHSPSGNTFALQVDSTTYSGGPNTTIVDVDATTYDAYMSGGTADKRIWSATATVPSNGQGATVNRIPVGCVNSENATPNWAYGSWNNRDGYPACVTFFRGRLAFARDNDIEISVSQDFENFSSETPGALITADMAISIQVPLQDPIEWLQDGRVLVAGSASTETLIAESNPSQALGPSNVATKPGTLYGSRGIQAITIGQSLLFVQATGYKLRMIRYNFYVDTYDGPEISAMADEIMLPNVTQVAYQKEPDSVLWFVRSDGVLVGLTYKIESQGIGIEEERVIGWHEHNIGGTGVVESVASIPAPDGTQDDLWMIVNRNVNGVTRRYVELMTPHYLAGEDITTAAVYVDSAHTEVRSIAMPGTQSIAVIGLDYLDGQIVTALVGGADMGTFTVTGGQIVIPNVSIQTVPRLLSIVVGLPYTERLTTMPLEAGSQDGTAQGKVKRVIGVRIRFRNTAGPVQIGAVNPDNEPYEDLDEIDFRRPTDPMDAAVPLFNGFYPFDKKMMPWPTGYEQEAALTVQGMGAPLPVTVVGIYPIMETNE